MKRNQTLTLIITFIAIFFSFNSLISENLSFNIIKKTDTEITFKYSNTSATDRVIVIIREAKDSIFKIDINNKFKTNDSALKLSEFTNIDKKYFVLVDSSNLKTIEKSVAFLKPVTKYSIDLYKINKDKFSTESFPFATLAPEPTEQASQIAFIGKETDKITLTWTNGNGTGRVVFASMDTIKDFPLDGVEYKSSRFFSDSVSKVKNNSETFCVYNSLLDSEKRITINNVGYGDYFFRIFEFKGSKDSINYLTSSTKSNPRNKFIYILKAPKALDAEKVTNNSFDAKWKHVLRCQGYLLEVAEDEAFTKMIDIFNPADVGYCESINVDGLKPNTIYFYRLRTIGYDDISEYSNIIKVKTKK